MISTRFAPSPTGSLHVGSARTALFNWAFAKKHKGTFYLRIDDTDTKRNIAELVPQLIGELRWLGMDWDDKIVYQSRRQASYEKIIEYLLDEGFAYPEQNPQGEACIYFDVDRVSTGTRVVQDLILGDIKFDTDKMTDFVIQRSDGTPLYNFATVVDDIDFQISHVIRGQEHLTNTFYQSLIYDALDMPRPRFAHIPFICSPDSNKKLSKRDVNVATIEGLRNDGYDAKAMVNYLTHLGWALDGETEIWDADTFVKNFELSHVSASPAKFDPTKMMWVQSQYMKDTLLQVKCERVDTWLKQQSMRLPDKAMLYGVVSLMGDRFRIAKDIEPYLHFFEEKKYALDPRAKKKFLSHPAALHLLETYLEEIRQIDNAAFTYDSEIADKAHALYELAGKVSKGALSQLALQQPKPSILIHALRAATTGQTVGFGTFEGMILLGKSRCIRRIEETLKELKCPELIGS